MLSWNSSPNAVSYTGKAVSTDGHIVTCEAGMNLGCQMNGLQCGKEYTFTVSASDGDCHSPDSEPVMHTTGERESSICAFLLFLLPKHQLPFTFVFHLFIFLLAYSVSFFSFFFVLCPKKISLSSSTPSFLRKTKIKAVKELHDS